MLRRRYPKITNYIEPNCPHSYHNGKSKCCIVKFNPNFLVPLKLMVGIVLQLNSSVNIVRLWLHLFVFVWGYGGFEFCDIRLAPWHIGGVAVLNDIVINLNQILLAGFEDFDHAVFLDKKRVEEAKVREWDWLIQDQWNHTGDVTDLKVVVKVKKLVLELVVLLICLELILLVGEKHSA